MTVVEIFWFLVKVLAAFALLGLCLAFVIMVLHAIAAARSYELTPPKPPKPENIKGLAIAVAIIIALAIFANRCERSRRHTLGSPISGSHSPRE